VKILGSSQRFELRLFGKEVAKIGARMFMHKSFIIHHSRFTLAAVAAVFLGGLHGFAQTTNQWVNSGNGLWSTGSNWSSTRPPDSTCT